MFEQLLTRREQLLGELESVCNSCGRKVSGVRIIAVTKFFPADVIRTAFEVGFREIGENRIQDAEHKQAELSGLALRWHCIGHLQTNKAKPAVEIFDEIHGLDRSEIIDRIATAATAAEKKIYCYLQVNVSGKSGQSGCEPGQIESLLVKMHSHPMLIPVGLMCIAAPVDEVGEKEVQRQFATLRTFRDRAISQGLLDSKAGLSMGMSSDWKLAVSEGATLVRIGTAIFGERNYAK